MSKHGDFIKCGLCLLKRHPEFRYFEDPLKEAVEYAEFAKTVHSDIFNAETKHEVPVRTILAGPVDIRYINK